MGQTSSYINYYKLMEMCLYTKVGTPGKGFSHDTLAAEPLGEAYLKWNHPSRKGVSLL